MMVMIKKFKIEYAVDGVMACPFASNISFIKHFNGKKYLIFI